MKINKQSSTYFVGFFTVVIFGFILMLYIVQQSLEQKIEQAKVQELNNLLKTNMQCNYKKNNIANKDFYYCEGSNIIALHDFSNGYIDKIEYIALFDIDSLFIKHISIINHKETPGLGDKVTNSNWLATIYNKVKEEVQIKIRGGKVDSFTAATVTPLRFLANLRNNIKWLNNNKKQIKQIIE